MAGSGFAPKPADKRARRNKDPIPTRVVELERTSAPALPDSIDWHERTRNWWAMWSRSALSTDFTEADWNFLADTAVIHSKFWNGDMSVAAELRLRVAKFGMTPEDRARLRIVFADADQKDEKRSTSSPTPQKGTTYGNLRAVAEEK